LIGENFLWITASKQRMWIPQACVQAIAFIPTLQRATRQKHIVSIINDPLIQFNVEHFIGKK